MIGNVWGIDPDTKNITLAEVTSKGRLEYVILSGGKGQRAEDRVEKLYVAFHGLVQAALVLPTWAYIEKPMFTVNPSATIAQSQIVGVMRAALWRYDVPHSLVDPGVWKKALLGNGRASKEEIKAWSIARFGLEDTLAQDVYDAAAIAEWGAQRLGKEPA